MARSYLPAFSSGSRRPAFADFAILLPSFFLSPDARRTLVDDPTAVGEGACLILTLAGGHGLGPSRNPRTAQREDPRAADRADSVHGRAQRDDRPPPSAVDQPNVVFDPLL